MAGKCPEAFDNQRFPDTSHYVLYMPDKEQLIFQAEAVLEKRKENGRKS